MVLVVLGIDALDPDLVDPEAHPNLVLTSYRAIDTIDSAEGEPSTHELWPTIITGLPPVEHGLELSDGVAWEHPLFSFGSKMADWILPGPVQTKLGAWLLNNTSADAFRVPAAYYEENDLPTVFDGYAATAIGVPNYVVDESREDREHTLRRSLGDLFERNPDAKGGHTSADPHEFYERCLEMTMIRIARARRAVRSSNYELVFAYTSGLDLIGHVSYDLPDLQQSAYNELNEFVGELRTDLSEGDELLLVSDHGLQDGTHTHEAMVASTAESMAERITSVVDVKQAIETELNDTNHRPTTVSKDLSQQGGDAVREQLQDLGYM